MVIYLAVGYVRVSHNVLGQCLAMKNFWLLGLSNNAMVKLLFFAAQEHRQSRDRVDVSQVQESSEDTLVSQVPGSSVLIGCLLCEAPEVFVTHTLKHSVHDAHFLLLCCASAGIAGSLSHADDVDDPEVHAASGAADRMRKLDAGLQHLSQDMDEHKADWISDDLPQAAHINVAPQQAHPADSHVHCREDMPSPATQAESDPQKGVFGFAGCTVLQVYMLRCALARTLTRPNPPSAVKAGKSTSIESREAPVAVIEYVDWPYCSRYWLPNTHNDRTCLLCFPNAGPYCPLPCISFLIINRSIPKYHGVIGNPKHPLAHHVPMRRGCTVLFFVIADSGLSQSDDKGIQGDDVNLASMPEHTMFPTIPENTPEREDGDALNVARTSLSFRSSTLSHGSGSGAGREDCTTEEYALSKEWLILRVISSSMIN